MFASIRGIPHAEQGRRALEVVDACITKAEAYTPRSPRKSQYYRCIESHFEKLEGIWDEKYQREYGYWRPYVMDVMY